MKRPLITLVLATSPLALARGPLSNLPQHMQKTKVRTATKNLDVNRHAYKTQTELEALEALAQKFPGNVFLYTSVPVFP